MIRRQTAPLTLWPTCDPQSMDWKKLLFWRKTDAHDYEVLGNYDPARIEDGDRQVIEQLQRTGADLSKARDVKHYLYVPTARAQSQTAAALRRDGYTVDERLAADASENPPNKFLVLASIDAVVSAQSVEEMRKVFEKLALEHGGEYDGWEAAAKP